MNQNKAVKKKVTKRQQDEQINITTETAAEGDKSKTDVDESQILGSSKRKKQTGMEILREADPDCTQQQLDRFYKRLTEIMNCVSITDDAHTNIIQVLRKIEEALNFHCAARNFLADRFKRLNQKIDGMDIEQFEIAHRSKKKELERGKKQ